MLFLQVTKSEGGTATGDSAESLAEDLLKRFSDSQPDIKKEPVSGKYFYVCRFFRRKFCHVIYFSCSRIALLSSRFSPLCCMMKVLK